MSKKYDIIVMDPPWKYGGMKQLSRHVRKHYLTQSMKTMMAWDIQKMCKPTTMLYMWTTGPKLMDAQKLFDAWGFEYKTVALYGTNNEYVLGFTLCLSVNTYLLRITEDKANTINRVPKTIHKGN